MPESGNEDLRAELKAVQYELSTIKQERQLVELRHEKELREVQRKAEADFKRAQSSETDSHVAQHKHEALAEELKDAQDQAASRQSQLERQLRTEQDQHRALQEELEEVQTELSSQERQFRHQMSELEARLKTVRTTAEELQTDLTETVTTLQATQRHLAERESGNGELESEVLRLKAQTGDADTLNVIKHELSEQVGHIRRLEAANRDQSSEIKRYKKQHKSLEVVEEEKRALEGRLRLTDDLTREVAEAQLQKQILEDERRAWTSYLQTQAAADGTVEFESPEALAKGLVQERVEKASLMDKLGSIAPELSEKDSIIHSLEAEKIKLQSQVDKARAGGSGDTKIRFRLERQRVLAEKEVEYLRAQLKTFDAEETTFMPASFDAAKTRRIEELEAVVDAYRKELATVNAELAQTQSDTPVPEAASTKRAREDEPDERLGQLSRKNRRLQNELSQQQQTTALLRTSLAATESQLATLQSASRTRVLALRANPTADHEAIQSATLAALRAENAALLAQLSSQAPDSVPFATLDPLRLELAAQKSLVAERDKRMARLKQIWTAKSLEFREAVASILGFKMDFMPNGRVRMTSLFFREDDDGDDDGENSIIFDGEQGTMKVGGGRESKFRAEIEGLIRFWVEERKEIPCFLAAMTLEGYERRESRGAGV